MHTYYLGILRLLGIMSRSSQAITSFAADMGLEVNNREYVANLTRSPEPVRLTHFKATVADLASVAVTKFWDSKNLDRSQSS